MTNLKTIITAGVMGLATLLPGRAESDNLSGNVKYIQTSNESNSLGSYPETNVFYGLPRGMKGFTFMDLYTDGDGYFGKTSINKHLTHGVSAKAQAIHGGNNPVENIGLGASVVVPGLPERISASVTGLPVYLDLDGKRVNDKSRWSYFINTSLPRGFNVSSFGEWNVADSPKWTYGEIELTKQVGPVTIGYNIGLIDNDSAIPCLENRASVIASF
ncbi:MAG: hypothetical protein Q8P81_01660 [Nanoarchaeota archaeon]|nr:hypothetical protein [Nanoarchaeota archaeon]